MGKAIQDEFASLPNKQARRYARSYRDGHCTKCGAPPPLQTVRLCAKCAAYRRDHYHRRKAESTRPARRPVTGSKYDNLIHENPHPTP